MAAQFFARISSPLFVFASLAALAGAGCWGSDSNSWSPCSDEPPSCGSYCPGGGDTYAYCASDGWECPDLVSCDPPDSGDDDASADGGIITCDGVTSTLDCGDCNGTPIAPVCTTIGLACPVVSYPIEPVDAGGGDASPGDAGRGDAGRGDASAGDASAGDASSGDSGSTFDAGGDTCLEGAPCSAGESCTVSSGQTDLESCTCVSGSYVCQ